MALSVEEAKDMYGTMTEAEREALAVASIRLVANWQEQEDYEEDSEELATLQEAAYAIADELDAAAEPAFAAKAEADPVSATA